MYAKCFQGGDVAGNLDMGAGAGGGIDVGLDMGGGSDGVLPLDFSRNKSRVASDSDEEMQDNMNGSDEQSDSVHGVAAPLVIARHPSIVATQSAQKMGLLF